jgi:hypothetical protein
MLTEFGQGQGGGSVYAGTCRVTVSNSVRATRERLTSLYQTRRRYGILPETSGQCLLFPLDEPGLSSSIQLRNFGSVAPGPTHTGRPSVVKNQLWCQFLTRPFSPAKPSFLVMAQGPFCSIMECLLFYAWI